MYIKSLSGECVAHDEISEENEHEAVLDDKQDSLDGGLIAWSPGDGQVVFSLPLGLSLHPLELAREQPIEVSYTHDD